MASINFFYQSYATQFMTLNLDEQNLFISIPSEKDDNKFYRVELNEETMQATSCNCPGHRRWGHCKHAEIVNSAFAGYKAPAAAPIEPKVTEVEAGAWYIINANTQVWMNEGQWIAVGDTENAIELVMAHLEKQSAIAEAERIVKAQELDNIVQLPAGVAPINGTLHVKGPALAKTTDISTKGALTTNRGFSLLKVS